MPLQRHHPPTTGGPSHRPQHPVPYVVVWSGEVEPVTVQLSPDGLGICYPDEALSDRGPHEVLWARMRNLPGAGTPRYPLMHPARQYRAMSRLLCRDCAQASSRTLEGTLFLIPQPTAEERTEGWPGRLLTRKPPVCLPCAQRSRELHPRRTEFVAVRARKQRLYGVYGTLFSSADSFPQEVTDPLAPAAGATLAYGDDSTRFLLASALVAELLRCTETDLDTELERDGRR